MYGPVPFPRGMSHELAVVLRFFHILFAVAWVGGVAFSVFVIRRVMPRVEIPIRKAFLRQLVPVVTQYLPATGSLTILIGSALYLYEGRFDPAVLGGSEWGRTLLIALALALTMFLYGVFVSLRHARTIVRHFEEPECTHGPEVGALQKKFNQGQFFVLSLGFVVLGLMVFSAHILR